MQIRSISAQNFTSGGRMIFNKDGEGFNTNAIGTISSFENKTMIILTNGRKFLFPVPISEFREKEKDNGGVLYNFTQTDRDFDWLIG